MTTPPQPDRDLIDHLAALRTTAPDGVDEAVLLGTGLADGVSVFDSPLGAVAVVFNMAGVVSLTLGESPLVLRGSHARPVIDATPPAAWRDGIARAIEAGTPGSLPIDHRGRTPFQRAVLASATTIPRGEVRPYGWLAKEVGRDGAVRAVGSVMAGNRLPLIIPCHRVVRSDGMLGAYSLGGPANKRRLLAVEGVDADGLERLAAGGGRFVASDSTGVYCLPTCRHARRIGDAHRVVFATRGVAVDAGFRPCKVCRP